MKQFTLLIITIFLCLPVRAQINLKSLLDSIDWNGTESELILRFHNFIEKTKHEEWEQENSTSDYQFKNIKINEVTISKAPIRVNAITKKLFRINFFVYINNKDKNLKNSMDKYLSNLYGKPYLATNDEGFTVRNSIYWAKNKYKVNATYIASNDTYDYIISVEPLSYYPVKYGEAIVEHNPNNCPVPQILDFKVDNDENIIIKEVGKAEKVYKKTKKMATPKGDVISFEGGMFCYRKQDSDIVYMTQELAIRYPIDKENLKK